MSAVPPGLGEAAKELMQASVMKGDSAILFNSLTEDFKEKFTISELSRRLAQMEDQHGMFTRIGDPTEPVANPTCDGFWVFDVPMFVNQIEWLARISMNADHKLNDFAFTRKPFYICPSYFNPHKVETKDLNYLPIIKYVKPSRRKTRKLPIAVFVHPVVGVDYNGQIGLRYPFRDLDFLAQRKVGLIRSSYESYGEPDPIVSIARHGIDHAANIEENGCTLLMLHSFASLFLPAILASRDTVKGVILLNPAWEAMPNSGLENMTDDRVPKDLPMLIVGSEFDQVMIRGHFDAWKTACPNADGIWVDKADHFLMTADSVPDEGVYEKTEGHVSEHAMRKIAKWVREKFQLS